MTSAWQVLLRSWSIPPVATFVLLLTAVVYVRGWMGLRRAVPAELPPWRAASFLAGLFLLWSALASWVDTFSAFVLTAHMLQHMLLMMAAPPLLLLGAPLIPIVRGLPRFAAREFAGPFLNWPLAVRVGNGLANPAFALILIGVVNFAWHTPRFYELALGSNSWHEVEHASFFLASMIFWWPVVEPWPSKARWPRWAMVPYLFIGDLQNTILSAILIFSDKVIYPSYARMPRLFGLSAQADQAAAGALMWVLGGFAYVFPAVVVAIRCLSRRSGDVKAVAIPREKFHVIDDASSVRSNFRCLANFARPRVRSRVRDLSWFVAVFLVTGLCLSLLMAVSSDDDDQTLRWSRESGPFNVAVFAPVDLEARPTSFSVLVQDRSTREALLDWTMELSARPANSENGSVSSVRATHEDSRNKLLRTAEMDLPFAGDWTLNITLRRNSKSAGFWLPLRVEKRESRLYDFWPYLVFPGFGMLLWGTYQWMHRLDGATTRPVRIARATLP
jgi:cytochrome c oxidase assembly factor CtaG